VNKTVTDFGGIYTDIPPVATALAVELFANIFCTVYSLGTRAVCVTILEINSRRSE